MDKLFLSVLNMSVTASYITLFILVARLLLKKTPKIFSYALWSVALFRLVCPFSFESIVSIFSVTGKTVEGVAPIINSFLPLPEVTTITHYPNSTTITTALQRPHLKLFTIIWLCGAFAMLVYSIIQFIRLKRKLIAAIPLRDNIYLADHISSPFVMGFVKPKIYLPSSMDESEQEFVIAHERHHIKRFDHITRIVSFIALAIHWFNPLTWIAFVLSGKDMEMSCDEAVMKKMDSDIRREYSQALLHFATGKKLITATPLAFGEGDTKNRIKNVLNYKKPAFWVIVVAIIAVSTVAMILISDPKSEGQLIETKSTATQKLWESRTEYVGNNAAVGNIISGLSFPENLKQDGIELHTAEPPYGITVKFKTDAETRNYYAGASQQEEFENNAIIMFSLIENVEYITFSLDDSVQEPFSFQYTSDQAKYILGENYFARTETQEGLEAVIAELSKLQGVEKDKLTHDQAVATALFSLSQQYLSQSECFSEGHIILGYDDSDSNNKTKIYALTGIGGYGFENGRFVQTSGASFPAVITLDSDNNVEIEEPLDGSGYAKSLEKMFPKEYHNRVFGYEDSDRESIKQQQEKYASEYLLKIGRDAEIGDYSNFDRTSPTDLGVSVEVANKLEDFYKQHSYYPSFLGNRERLEGDIRMVYELSYHEIQNEIRFTKYVYESQEKVEQFVFDSITGKIIE